MGEKGKRSRDVILVGVIAAAAVLLRFIAISYRGIYLCWDESMYLVLGRNFLSGEGYQLFGLSNITFPALVPVLGGAVWLVTGGTRWALSGPSAVLGGLAVIPVYLLAKRMFSRRAAFAAATIFAGFRALLVFSPFCWYKLRLYAGSEQIFVFITAWALYFFWRAWQDRSVICAAGAGLACGVGFLARQEALVLVGVMWVWLAGAELIERRRLSGNLAARLCLAAALFAAGSAPFFLYAKSVTGHFLLGPHVSHNIVVREAFMDVYFQNDWRKFLRLYLELSEDATQFNTSYYGVGDYHRGTYKDYSNANIFSKLARGTHVLSLRYWFKDMLVVLPLYFAPFVAVGLFAKGAGKRLTRAGFFAAALVPAAMIACILLLLPRYNVYTSVVLVVFGAAGVTATAEFVKDHDSRAAGRVCIAIALALAAAGAGQALWFNAATRADPNRELSFTMAITPMADTRERHIEKMIEPVAAELRRIDPEKTRVITHDPGFALLAGDVWIPLPMESFDRIIDFARHQGVSLIVLKSKDLSLREFTFEEALSRTDVIEVLFRREIDGEDVAIMRVLPGSAPAVGGS